MLLPTCSVICEDTYTFTHFSDSKAVEGEGKEPSSSSGSVGGTSFSDYRDISSEIAATAGGTSVGRSFSSLSDVVSDKTLKAIGEMGFTDMMEIQYRSIRPLLEGR